MGRYLLWGRSAAAGVMLLMALTTGCAALGGDRTSADKLASDAVRAIVNTQQVSFQGASRAAVDGYELPQMPTFAGRLTNGTQLVMAVRPDPVATNHTNPQKATFTRESTGAWKATDEQGAPLLRWNPLPWLEQLPQLKRQASIDAKQSDASTRVVRVVLEPAEVKRLVSEQLHQERQRVQDRLAAELRTTPKGLSAAQANARSSELTSTGAQAAQQLDQMLATLQAEGEMTFWLDRATNRPSKLLLTTQLHYRSGGRDRQETASTDYTFGDEGNNALLPT